MSEERLRWARRLSALAEPRLAGTPLTTPSDPATAIRFIEAFRDDLGHRRPVDRPLLGAILGLPTDAIPTRADSPDVRAWSSVQAGVDPPGLIGGDGPLLFAAESPGIEVATETELAVLHALWRRAVLGPSPAARERALSAAAWSVATLQPDNGTGHPWAVAVFIELWMAGGNADARLYAETLVHNSVVAEGRPDRFSAVLLLDSARVLTAAAQAG